MKTNELTGRALQHAVMLAEDWDYFPATIYECAMYGKGGGPRPTWTVTGPDYLTGQAGDAVIDRHRISTVRLNDLYFPSGNEKGEHWEAYFCATCAGEKRYGATRREAAMRAYVASKLGEEVEIPDEFLEA